MRAIVLAGVGAAALVLALAAGCSHNSVNYSDGIGLETTFRPDSGNFGLTFRYGKILSAVLRENSEVEMTGDGSGGGSSGESATANAASSGSVKIKIGRQITGYYVDALAAGADRAALDKYLGDGGDGGAGDDTGGSKPENGAAGGGNE